MSLWSKQVWPNNEAGWSPRTPATGTPARSPTAVAYTSLDERVRQVIVLTVGAIWHADYELYAHAAVARKAELVPCALASHL